MQLARKPRILFLFSDTGGGHRSPTEAMIEAIRSRYGDRIDVDMVDFFTEYAPTPLDKIPEWYAILQNNPLVYRQLYKVLAEGNTHKLITSGFWPYVRRAARHLLRDHPSDMIVVVHAFANDAVARAVRTEAHRRLFVTMVTDLVNVPNLWFHPKADLCLVATAAAEEQGLKLGLRREQLKVTGLPISPRFLHVPESKTALKLHFGFDPELPVALVVGGGDGFGAIKEITGLLSEHKLPVSLAVVTGRNTKLREELETGTWDIPVHVFGFTKEMPELMKASDMIISKGGSNTLSEAFANKLPIIIYGYIDGQETGNVQYVTSNGAGVLAPRPGEVLRAVDNWINSSKERREASLNASLLAVPGAADQIADLLAGRLGVGKQAALAQI